MTSLATRLRAPWDLAVRLVRSPFWTGLGMLWECSPSHALRLYAVILWKGLQPAAYAVSIGLLVDAVPAGVRGVRAGDGLGPLTVPLALVIGLFLGQLAVGEFGDALTRALAWRVDRRLGARVLSALNAPPGLAELEDPSTGDRVAVATGTAVSATGGRAVELLQFIGAARLGGVVNLALLLRFAWWAPVVTVVGTLAFAWWAPARWAT